MSDLELRRGSSVYMNSTGDYHLRRRGKPGILATLVLPFDVADELTAALQERARMRAMLAELGFCPKDGDSMPCTTCGAGL